MIDKTYLPFTAQPRNLNLILLLISKGRSPITITTWGQVSTFDRTEILSVYVLAQEGGLTTDCNRRCSAVRLILAVGNERKMVIDE
jgi:hypothetical protein